MKKIALLMVLMLVSSGTFAQQLTKDEKRALELKPGVVLIILFVGGTATFKLAPVPIPISYRISGSGFLYRPDGYIVTNGHVVEYANVKDPRQADALRELILEGLRKRVQSGEAFAPIEKALGFKLNDKQKALILKEGVAINPGQPTLKVILANGKTYDGDILQYSPPITKGKGKDVAVIKIPGNDLPTVPLGDSESVRVEDPVMVIGYPGTASATLGDNPYISTESDLVPSATNGHISAIKATTGGSPVLQTDVAITHGNSGGPAFDQNGKAIGIATFGTEAAGFNFLVPINTAMEFVRQAGVSPAPSSFDNLWSKALDLYDAGKCKPAISEFDNVLQLMPGLPDAKQYRNLAAKCWNDKTEVQKFMETSGWVVYAAVGIILLALAVLLFRRRPAAVVKVAPGVAATVRIESPPSAAALPPAARADSFGSIQATSGPLSGRTFKVTKDGLLIGRSSKCQVVLQDDTISGEHAWIVPTDNEVVVIDRGSANGTYVNSVESPKVSKIGLRNGDRIYLGKKGAAVFTYFNS